MRTLIQRVQHASVTIDGQLKSKIGKGLLVLVGIEDRDTQEDIEWLCKKIANLRIFDDENGVMNRSVVETEGEVMVVSQFTHESGTGERWACHDLDRLTKQRMKRYGRNYA